MLFRKKCDTEKSRFLGRWWAYPLWKPGHLPVYWSKIRRQRAETHPYRLSCKRIIWAVSIDRVNHIRAACRRCVQWDGAQAVRVGFNLVQALKNWSHNRFFGESGNKDLFNSHIESLAAKLDAYDAILGKQKYIAGDVSFFLFLLPCWLVPSPAWSITGHRWQWCYV